MNVCYVFGLFRPAHLLWIALAGGQFLLCTLTISYVAVHPMLCIQSQVGYNANTYALMQTWIDMGLDFDDVV